jgi:ferrous iron transport protein A
MYQWLAEANRQIFRRCTVNLLQVEEGIEYIVDRIETDDEELDAFLFSLGCYSGEPITVVARRRSGLTVSVKDGRYNIDKELGSAIFVK